LQQAAAAAVLQSLCFQTRKEKQEKKKKEREKEKGKTKTSNPRIIIKNFCSQLNPHHQSC
jgi:hypothetical protein